MNILKRLALGILTLAFGALLAHCYHIYQTKQLNDDCARTNNVYACKIISVPVKAPEIAYVEPTLLPPPAI